MLLRTTSDAATASDPPHGDLLPVAILDWPGDPHHRARLRALGRPCLLLVAPAAAPPTDCDELEDWIRLPAEDADIALRLSTLARRAPRRPLVATPIDAASDAVLCVLVQHLRRPLRRESVRDAWIASGGAASHGAFDRALARCRRDLAAAGWRVDTIQGGLLLVDHDLDDEAEHHRDREDVDVAR